MNRLVTSIYGPLMFVAGLYVGWRLFAYSPATQQLRDPKYAAAACSEDFVTAWQAIKEQHVGEPVTDAQLRHGAIAGMTAALKDQHSSFLTPEEAKEDTADFAGKFYGIGAVMQKSENGLIFETVMPGSPAENAGLLANDQLISINGENVSKGTPQEAAKLIRGDEGTVVKLTIRRGTTQEPMEFSVTRGEIKNPSVKDEIIHAGDKTFMRITVSSFHDDTDELFGSAAARAVGDGMDGVIVDLRNDGGGRVGAAVRMACRWRTDSPIVYILRRGDAPEALKCPWQVNDLLSDMPTVVLVNKNTASAAEVFTGALQDFGAAYVIGEKTYGKGCGQDIFQFEDGARMCLVTFLWKTPNGRSIHRTGLMPDEVLKANPEDLAAGKDVQMARAVQYLQTGR